MTSLHSLHQQVALITAAGSGLGKGIALELASRGALVHVWDRDTIALQNLAEESAAAGYAIETRLVNLSKDDEIHAAFAANLQQSKKIDILIILRCFS